MTNRRLLIFSSEKCKTTPGQLPQEPSSQECFLLCLLPLTHNPSITTDILTSSFFFSVLPPALLLFFLLLLLLLFLLTLPFLLSESGEVSPSLDAAAASVAPVYHHHLWRHHHLAQCVHHVLWYHHCHQLLVQHLMLVHHELLLSVFHPQWLLNHVCQCSVALACLAVECLSGHGASHLLHHGQDLRKILPCCFLHGPFLIKVLNVLSFIFRKHAVALHPMGAVNLLHLFLPVHPLRVKVPAGRAVAAPAAEQVPIHVLLPGCLVSFLEPPFSLLLLS